MATFVVEFEYTVDRAGREHLHPAHTDYLRALTDRGVLLLAGPLQDANGGLLVYEAEDRDHLQDILDAEPYVDGGIVGDVRVRRWAPGKGTGIAPQPSAA
ncbi:MULTISPECIES: YciI family protein [unclassified Streptomyces]|uniref:YciI family protein n=1 Tax=unclassified Streptomyces TaxID=2593676 RepID=UPI002E2F8AD9|nr:YciI family protein [Streptomyces sp. NBC_01460]WSS27185.1 YciI family protein [Streptomyces sp. NBC_01185]